MKDFIEKFWNKDIAGHPLNWLILVVMTIYFCFLIDAALTATGATKHVTNKRLASKGTGGHGTPNRGGPSPNQSQQTVNDVVGTSDWSEPPVTL